MLFLIKIAIHDVLHSTKYTKMLERHTETCWFLKCKKLNHQRNFCNQFKNMEFNVKLLEQTL